MPTRLPAFLCAALFAVALPACDEHSPTGPQSDDELALFDFRAQSFPDGLPGYPGDGDITIVKTAASSGGNGGVNGGDIIIFDIVGASVHDSAGTEIQTLTDYSIKSPTGATVCSKTTSGIFSELRDSDGSVLYSTYGPWVFAGAPKLDGLTASQQYQELESRLMVTFDGEAVIEGFPLSGEAVVESTHDLVFANSMRKLVVTSLVDGSCGSNGIP